MRKGLFLLVGVIGFLAVLFTICPAAFADGIVTKIGPPVSLDSPAEGGMLATIADAIAQHFNPDLSGTWAVSVPKIRTFTSVGKGKKEGQTGVMKISVPQCNEWNWCDATAFLQLDSGLSGQGWASYVVFRPGFLEIYVRLSDGTNFSLEVFYRGDTMEGTVHMERWAPFVRIGDAEYWSPNKISAGEVILRRADEEFFAQMEGQE